MPHYAFFSRKMFVNPSILFYNIKLLINTFPAICRLCLYVFTSSYKSLKFDHAFSPICMIFQPHIQEKDKLKANAWSYMSYDIVFGWIQLQTIHLHKHHFKYTSSEHVMGYWNKGPKKLNLVLLKQSKNIDFWNVITQSILIQFWKVQFSAIRSKRSFILPNFIKI